MLCFSQPDSQPHRIYGEVVVFLEHVCKIRALLEHICCISQTLRASWQQIRRISQTLVAIGQPYHQHFAYVFEEYVDFESPEIKIEDVVQEISFFNKIDVFLEHVCKQKC